ncbi:GRIP and coiled-coil domain-containing protein 2 [Protopterus annectens]|uniref:GRIP and coiled-coil domain-containing protein 2 n=1 Tax=Protopterus annectens TaxID=7888 RepID=UPI001CF9D083|nr:GRIP and coiled-coil domain-containing protein 2 [Protopterus annectens]
MMEQESGQDAAVVATAQGTGKSKLDNLSKDDLVKFAKKQMMLLQKAKLKSAELEKEIEELKRKSSSESNDALIQELTERFDAVLLEKAECQQSLSSLKKENEKTKKESEDAVMKITELQKQLDDCQNNHLKEAQSLSKELEFTYSKHKEEVAEFERVVHRYEEEKRNLVAELEQQKSHQDIEQRHQEEEKQLKEHILQLKKKFEDFAEEKELEIKRLQEINESALADSQNEARRFCEELNKMKSAHLEEVSRLTNQIDILTVECEKERNEHDQLIQHFKEEQLTSEKQLQDDLQDAKEKYEQELVKLKEQLRESEGKKAKCVQVQLNKSVSGGKKGTRIDSAFKELESQHKMLKDELKFLNNVKVNLEQEVQQMKAELFREREVLEFKIKEMEQIKADFFHEREELEFKINELQLSKEDYVTLLAKMKAELQSTAEQYEMTVSQHSQELQLLKQSHKEEIAALRKSLLQVSEKEKQETSLEIDVLKQQCEKLLQEKEEAVSNYESIRVTLETLEAELNVSAENIKHEFRIMKEQQASEIFEMQQKLRSALKEKDNLLETVSKLHAEAEQAAFREDQLIELKQTVKELQEKNNEMKNSVNQKNAALRDMEEKITLHCAERDDALAKLNESDESISKLRELYENEKANSAELLQQIEKLNKINTELKETLIQSSEVQQSIAEDNFNVQKMEELQSNLNLALCDREKLSSEINILHEKMSELHERNAKIQKDVIVTQCDSESMDAVREKLDSLECEMQSISEERDNTRKLVEDQQQKMSDFKTHICAVLRQEGYVSADVAAGETLEDVIEILKASLSKCNSNTIELKQRLAYLSEQILEAATEKDQSCQKLDALQIKLDISLHEKKDLFCKLKILYEEILQFRKQIFSLQEDMKIMQSECQRLVVDIIAKVADMERNLQDDFEEKESTRKQVNGLQQKMFLIQTQLCGILELEGFMPTEEAASQSLESVLETVKTSLVKLRKEIQSISMTTDKRVLQLQEEVEQLQKENANQHVERDSVIDELKRERDLLKVRLEELLVEKEALQTNLLEMKSSNEKTQLLNQELLVRIDDISKDLDCAIKKSEESTKYADEIKEECHNLEDILKQRESDLSDLTAELDKLKDLLKKSSVEEHAQQSTVTELNDRIANLEKESISKDEKMNKIKAVALKTRKELDTSRKEVQSLTEELEAVKSERDRISMSLKELIQGAESYKNLLMEYDKQAEQLDMEKKRAHSAERQVEDVTKHLQSAIQQQDELTSCNEDLLARIETTQSNLKQVEAQLLETQKAKVAVEKKLEAEKLMKEQKMKDHSTALKEVEQLQKQLQKEKTEHQQTTQELELVKKDAQKSTLMDMEMADYERLVKELNQKVAEKDGKIVELVEELKIQKQKQTTLQEEVSSLQSSLEQSEERSAKMKQLLVKAKKELADSKKAEADQLVQQASLKGELEASQQLMEDCKIKLADVTAEKHRLQEQMKSYTEQHQRTGSALQQKISALQEECSTVKAEQASTAAEFESYKVRVHNVLKQQKNKSSQSENDASKQEREHLEILMDQLRNKLQETQNNLQLNASELQVLQCEHDTLLERHNKMLQETVTKEAELREKLCTIQSENMVLKSEHAQTVSQLTAQNEALRNNFRDQVRQLQEDHRKTVETLQQQLSKVETQLFQLQQESSAASPAASSQPLKTLRERRTVDVSQFDMNSLAREEGEGMETTETESVSSTSTQVLSLEQLLNSSDLKLEPPQWQPEPTKEELAQKLSITAKSIDHLNGLLRENEATNAALLEQIKLLKSEVRRLERNQEREKSVANLEYLKNVLLQFIFLKSGSERVRLLPVINTMLQLSPEEKNKLTTIAHGEEETASRSAGWSSYLHSWSGLR